MAASEDMRAFQALSYSDKWRVTRLLTKGGAPADPRMAAAAIELGERYQRQRRASGRLRWAQIAVAIGAGAVIVLSALDGDALRAIVFALLAAVNVAHLVLNPITRPQNVARSLEASRRIIASEG